MLAVDSRLGENTLHAWLRAVSAAGGQQASNLAVGRRQWRAGSPASVPALLPPDTLPRVPLRGGTALSSARLQSPPRDLAGRLRPLQPVSQRSAHLDRSFKGAVEAQVPGSARASEGGAHRRQFERWEWCPRQQRRCERRGSSMRRRWRQRHVGSRSATLPRAMCCVHLGCRASQHMTSSCWAWWSTGRACLCGVAAARTPAGDATAALCNQRDGCIRMHALVSHVDSTSVLVHLHATYRPVEAWRQRAGSRKLNSAAAPSWHTDEVRA